MVKVYAGRAGGGGVGMVRGRAVRAGGLVLDEGVTRRHREAER